ncbi:MAG: electron transfer flavoprotein subunit alpha/FixB family protein [Candidatus Bipolaricaulota bacterium]
MSDVMVFAENNGNKIHPVSYELLGKGKELADKLGGELTAALLSGTSLPAGELIERGADRVYRGTAERLAEPIESSYREVLVQVIEEANPEVILIGATNFGRSLAPRVAMALDTSLTADCTGLDIDEEKNFVQIRPAFSGNILAHIKSRTSPQLATVRYREFPEAGIEEGKEGEVIDLELSLDGEDTKQVEVLDERRGKKVNLEDAEVVVAAGRGLKKEEDFELIEDLASFFDGKVGASRPLVDDGWIGRAHQVGYSGRRVKPRIYIACGISGQSQHLAGMKDSDMIIAINSDPSAPIFDYADYGLVGDLYEVVPELTRQLKGE